MLLIEIIRSMKLIKTYFKIILLSSCLYILSCNRTSKYVSLEGNINLKWNPSHDTQTINDAVTGLRWALSYIGAYNTNTKTFGISVKNDLIRINLKELGFQEKTKQAILKLNNKIKKTEAYKHNKSLDLGHYISLLIGVSKHYYKFVDIPKDLNELLSKYQLKPYKGKIDNSLVSLQHRVIEYSNQSGLKQLFISKEIDSLNGNILEFETIELMGNGQLKFGIYDETGKRKLSANPQNTKAGKPGKCIWCHESKISPLFTPQRNYESYMSHEQLDDTLVFYKNTLFEKQLTLTKGVDYNKLQEHTQMELLYISFMEPSAKRLSSEWNIPLQEVQMKLSSLKTHKHKEFSFLGDLYHRKDVMHYEPYNSLEVSSSIREKSINEVNYID